MSGNNEGFDSFQPGVAQVGKISWSYDPANFRASSPPASENGLMRSSADSIVVSRDKGNSSARRKF